MKQHASTLAAHIDNEFADQHRLARNVLLLGGLPLVFVLVWLGVGRGPGEIASAWRLLLGGGVALGLASMPLLRLRRRNERLVRFVGILQRRIRHRDEKLQALEPLVVAPEPAPHRKKVVDGLADAYTVDVAASASPAAGATDTLASQARRLVLNHMDEAGFDAACLAELLHMSRRSLSRHLKEETGLTPAIFIRQVRLEYSRRLLEAGAAAKVQEAAIAVGFRDAGYFSRLFREHFSVSPAELLRSE